jgi:hypothetical protein
MRIFYILFITLLSSIQVKSQNSNVLANTNLQEPDLARHVKFYPNPATSQITFDFLKESDRGFSFQIFNFMGKKVFETQVNNRSILNLTEFTRGIYIFQLKNSQGTMIESGKFQVNK